MTRQGPHTFTGFGFGAIQSGLFLYEADRSGHFDRLVVAEVIPEVVQAVRNTGGMFRVNIAHADRIEAVEVGPIEIYDPAVQEDRQALLQAIAESHEIGTAVPSVRFYKSEGPGSIHRLLAEGLKRKAQQGGPRCVVYAAENHNHAAELLEGAVSDASESQDFAEQVRFLNTVVGKMSGVINSAQELADRKLAPMTPGAVKAFLVEEFNRILVTAVDFGGEPFERGIHVFEEKQDLLPFEEAKLYGHNAVHALAAYVGAREGAERIADLPYVDGVMPFLRAAFLEESGQALIRKYTGTDPLFTSNGFAAYADDLLERMTNPWLGDRVQRVARDPQRKLGWDDRLVGTMRLALAQGLTPKHFAMGVVAALQHLDPRLVSDPEGMSARLDSLWGAEAKAHEKQHILDLVEHARQAPRI